MVDGDSTNELFGTEADHPSLLRAMWLRLRGRMLAGLLLVLPFVITAWIVMALYRLIEDFGIRPIARLVVILVEGRTDGNLPLWFTNVVAPLIGILGVLGLLYFLGFFARSRADRILDAILHRIPIVTSIHKAVRQLFAALGGSGELTRFKRVVLVEFPHPGMRVPGFVTASCRDESTHKTILCVYVPTTPVPTSGYMLLIPEENVTELDWPLEQTIQAVVSFGITAPDRVRYYTDGSASGNVPDSRTSATPESKANGTL
jgi:uncharacterized membrane protein